MCEAECAHICESQECVCVCEDDNCECARGRCVYVSEGMCVCLHTCVLTLGHSSFKQNNPIFIIHSRKKKSAGDFHSL